MNIKREEIGELNALLTIEVSKGDYEQKLDEQLRNLSKKVQLKGFRPGKVPKNVVRKLYGDSVLAEELDKLVRNELSRYLSEEKINILGNPMPQDTEAITVDANDPGDFSFSYEVGISPELKLDALSKDTSLVRYDVSVGDEEVDQEWNNLLKRFGDLKDAEKVSEGDLLRLKFVELDDQGEVLAGGHFSEGSLNWDMIKDGKIAKEFLGKAAGDKVVVANLAEALEREEASVNKYVLNIEDGAPASQHFQLELTKVETVVDAKPDKDFFEKVFGPGEVEDEAQAREKISESIGSVWKRQSESYLQGELIKTLLDQTDMKLPEAFLRKWLASEQKSDSVSEEEFEQFRRNLKWSLIYREFSTEQKLEVSQEELEGAVRADIQRHFGPAWEQMSDEDVQGLVGRLLSDREHLEKVHGALMDTKVHEAMLEQITIEEKAISRKEFEDLLSDNSK